MKCGLCGAEPAMPDGVRWRMETRLARGGMQLCLSVALQCIVAPPRPDRANKPAGEALDRDNVLPVCADCAIGMYEMALDKCRGATEATRDG